MSRERSAGLILFRGEPGRHEFLLVRSRRHGAWGFPKGHVRPGETDGEAARREAAEEAGASEAEIVPGFRGALRYRLPAGGAEKEAVYFLARCPQSPAPASTDTTEIAELRWAALGEALELIPFPDARGLLESADRFLRGAGGGRVDYDRISSRYDRSRSFSGGFTRELLGLVPAEFRPGRALDAGCGTGNATRCLLEAWPGARAVGLDLSAGMLSRARGKLAGVDLVRGDAQHLPFGPGSFDLVFSAYVLHHLAEPRRFCAEAARILAGGGKLVILTAGHGQIRAHLLGRFFPRFADIDCARFPDLAGLRALLESSGLRPTAEREPVVADYPVDEAYLARVRDRHVSTFDLMTEDEFEAGLRRLTDWVRSFRGPEGERPRHTARGTLLVAEKP